MELDERKMKILQAIVKNYLETGEPVGSRTISKYTDLNLSSATIRNEMADLEEQGYILQPHTSAGRIPSDKGYRVYVDEMMKERETLLDSREKELDTMKDFLVEKVDRVETLLQNMAKVLAMISTPKLHTNRVKFIQLSSVEENQILCVLVLEGNIIKNKILNVNAPLNNETILKLNILLNSTLNGLTLEEINLGMISKMTLQAGEQSELIRSVLDAIAEAINSEKDMEIYTSGATNILKYPELSDSVNASRLIGTLEEKKLLTNLIADVNDGEEGNAIQIYIGDETPVQSMKDCSVVTATYELEDGMRGTIGVIGPKRMDYEKVVETLKTVKNQLDDAYKKL